MTSECENLPSHNSVFVLGPFWARVNANRDKTGASQGKYGPPGRKCSPARTKQRVLEGGTPLRTPPGGSGGSLPRAGVVLRAQGCICSRDPRISTAAHAFCHDLRRRWLKMRVLVPSSKPELWDAGFLSHKAWFSGDIRCFVQDWHLHVFHRDTIRNLGGRKHFERANSRTINS
jgi:hypothetical protein